MVDFRTKLNKGKQQENGSKPGTSKPSGGSRAPYRGIGKTQLTKSLPKLGAPPLPADAKNKTRGQSCAHPLLIADAIKFVDGYNGARFVAELTVGESPLHQEGDKVSLSIAFDGPAMGGIKSFLLAFAAYWPEDLGEAIAADEESDDAWGNLLEWAWGDEQPLAGKPCRTVNSQMCKSEGGNVYYRHDFEAVE